MRRTERQQAVIDHLRARAPQPVSVRAALVSRPKPARIRPQTVTNTHAWLTALGTDRLVELTYRSGEHRRHRHHLHPHPRPRRGDRPAPLDNPANADPLTPTTSGRRRGPEYPRRRSSQEDRPADSLSVVGGNRAVVSRPTASPVRWHFLLDTMWSSFRRGFKSSETSKTRGPAGG